jgi:hypothetical protein
VKSLTAKRARTSGGTTRAAKRKKAPRTYVRYDPIDGTRVKVTRDDPRFEEWSSRKSSKKTRETKLKREDPLAYAQTVGIRKAKQHFERAAEHAVIGVVQKGARVAASAARSGALSEGVTAAGAALPALGVVGALAAAGILGGWLMDKATDTTGDKINRISRAFVAAQGELIRRTGVKSWQQVPEGPRTKLLAEYKAALTHVAQNPGLARFEKTPTFGR